MAPPGSNTFMVSVANTAPTALLAGDSVNEGSPASVSFSFASDPSSSGYGRRLPLQLQLRERPELARRDVRGGRQCQQHDVHLR